MWSLSGFSILPDNIWCRNEHNMFRTNGQRKFTKKVLNKGEKSERLHLINIFCCTVMRKKKTTNTNAYSKKQTHTPGLKCTTHCLDRATENSCFNHKPSSFSFVKIHKLKINSNYPTKIYFVVKWRVGFKVGVCLWVSKHGMIGWSINWCSYLMPDRQYLKSFNGSIYGMEICTRLWTSN